MPIDLNVLAEIGTRAGRLAQEERKRLATELKSDGSLVTNADRKVEEFLRTELAPLASETSVWGEEFGRDDEGSNGIWLLDPIDGTSNFAMGLPTWGVSIARWQDGQLREGCIFLPDLEELYVAAKGAGATLNGEPIPAVVSGRPKAFELISCCPHIAPLIGSEKVPGRLRCFGASVVDGSWTVTQRLRGLYGMGERLYDVAATLVLATEVGLVASYTDGTPLNLPSLVAGTPIHRPWQIMPPVDKAASSTLQA